MASKRRIRRNSCEGKKKYETSYNAKDSMNLFIKINKPLEYYQVYKCKFCKKFHFGRNKTYLINK